MTIDNIIEDYESKPISRRNFLKILVALATVTLVLTFGILVKNSHAEDEWAKLKLYERETDEIVNEDGINFKIYIRGYSSSDKKYRVKYMLDSEKYVDRVFWGDWADHVLEDKDSIILIYDPNSKYTKKYKDYKRQEKIFQLFAKEYLDKKLNTNFDLYEINMKLWNNKQKLKLIKAINYEDFLNEGTLDSPTLILIYNKDIHIMRAPPIDYDEAKSILNIKP